MDMGNEILLLRCVEIHLLLGEINSLEESEQEMSNWWKCHQTKQCRKKFYMINDYINMRKVVFEVD